MTEPLSPVEARLTTLLLFLQVEAPRPTDDLKEAVMRGIRRQHVARAALAALEDLITALGRALAVVLGISSPPRTATA